MNQLARDIREMLELEGYQTIKQIHERYANLWSEKTIRNSLRQLRNKGITERIPNIYDMRQGGYRIKREKEDVFITQPVKVE